MKRNKEVQSGASSKGG